MPDQTEDQQSLVDAFNRAHHIGYPVRYWTGDREGDGKTSTTRTAAQLLGGHTAVVWVEGEASCIALTHVDPLPDQPDGIEDDSRDLPNAATAAERVRQYICATGDGLYDVQSGAPLYARDLEALTRAALAQDTYKRERDEALQDVQSLADDLSAVRTERDQIDADLAFVREEAKSIYDTCKQIERERDQLAAAAAQLAAAVEEHFGPPAGAGPIRKAADHVRQILDEGPAASPVPSRRAPEAGDRVEDGGMMGTLVRCQMCGGSGLLHQPDELPETATPTPEPNELTDDELAAEIDRAEEEAEVERLTHELLDALRSVPLPYEANRAAYRLRRAIYPAGESQASEPAAPVNLMEAGADTVRRYAGEVWRLASGLADRGIPLVPDCPVDTAPVDTALAALDSLTSTVRMLEGAVRLAGESQASEPAPAERLAATEPVETLAAQVAQAMRNANTPDAWTQGPQIIPMAHFARVAIVATLRAYAEDHQPSRAKLPMVAFGGKPLPWCVCGAPWYEDGCPARRLLLSDADRIERDGSSR